MSMILWPVSRNCDFEDEDDDEDENDWSRGITATLQIISGRSPRRRQ